MMSIIVVLKLPIKNAVNVNNAEPIKEPKIKSARPKKLPLLSKKSQIIIQDYIVYKNSQKRQVDDLESQKI